MIKSASLRNARVRPGADPDGRSRGHRHDGLDGRRNGPVREAPVWPPGRPASGGPRPTATTAVAFVLLLENDHAIAQVRLYERAGASALPLGRPAAGPTFFRRPLTNRTGVR